MSKLQWDKIGERTYETGVDHAVLFPIVDGTYPKGVAWSGITAINENPSGAEANPFYADNIKYLNIMSAEDFGASIEAYTYPTEFEACDGSAEAAPGVIIGQQTRKSFGLSYRTKIGNDTDGQDHGYKLHFIYNALAAPSSRSHQTVNASPEPTTLSWEVSTTPVDISGYNPTAHLTIDSTRTDARRMRLIEDIIYGTEKTEARMPMPEEIIRLMNAPLPTEATITPTPSGETRLTKPVSELQADISIENGKVKGELKHVTNFTGFSKTLEKQTGNFLSLELSATNSGEITTQLIGGESEPKKVTDGFCVYRITDNKMQKISVTVTKGDYSDTMLLDLSGLTCRTE